MSDSITGIQHYACCTTCGIAVCGGEGGGGGREREREMNVAIIKWTVGLISANLGSRICKQDAVSTVCHLTYRLSTACIEM